MISTSHSSTDGVTTDEDGSFVLERVPRDLVYLRLDGEDILSHEYGRNEQNLATLAGEGVEDLTIVVGLRVHLQVTLSDPARATQVVVLDAEGECVQINVIQGNSRREGLDASLEAGRTDVLTVPDSAATLVLLLDGEEVARQELNLVRGVVTQVRF